jgi:hypothetical protein
MSRCNRLSALKIALFAVPAAVVLAGIGTWAASVTYARVDRVDVLAGDRIDPTQIMKNVKDLPEAKFVDYTFVFIDDQ